ncbi:MAG TPA: ABC transporter permease [Vicinamibacterales bacterium]|nr:ABC transporter permease [Vicinamibacterales bacterium]
MNWLTDVRCALSVLRNRPTVPLLTAGLLALSVGLAGGLWAVVDAVALRPLPYPAAHELVAVMESHPERGLMSVTAANFWDWSTRVHALPHVAGLGRVEASLTGSGEPVRVVGTKVTNGFFDVMAVAPAVGRAFIDADFTADSRVVIISDGLWDRQFNRRPDALGTAVLLDGVAHTLVAVMPRSFKTVGNSDVWLPWVMTAPERADRRFHMVGVMARLGAGLAAVDAERELQSLYRQLAADHPETTDRWTARVVPLRELMLGDSRRALQVLGGAVVALLVVASINLVGLTFAWVRARQPELLIRMALGASAGRVSRQFLAEATVWALAGIVGGTWLATVFVRLFGAVGVSPSLEYDFEPRVDVGVVLAMAALLAFLAVATAAVPAWLATQRAGRLVVSRGSSVGRWGPRLALATQVALSVVLLCTAAAVLSGFRRALDVASPTSASGLAIDISLAETRYRDEPSQARYFERLLTELATRPEIANAAAASYVPPGRIYGNVRFSIEGQGEPTDAQTTLVSAVDPQAFSVLGIGVQRGRAIEARDGAGAPRVAVISAALARRYWGDVDPIGQRIVVAGDPTPNTIVGVVDDARQPLATDARAESILYVPYRQVPWPFMTVLIVPAGASAPALAALREEATRLDPAQALSAARPLDEIRNEWMNQPRLRSRIISVFGGAALLLTVAGLWARVSWHVAVRAREWAIRQAVGAQPHEVVMVAVREMILVVIAGVALGAALLPLSGAAVRAAIEGLPSPDARFVFLAAALFALCAATSAYLPARKAGQIDPAMTLRTE